MLVPLCVISVISTILVMVVTGRVSQSLIRKSFGGEKGVTAPDCAGEQEAGMLPEGDDAVQKGAAL